MNKFEKPNDPAWTRLAVKIDPKYDGPGVSLPCASLKAKTPGISGNVRIAAVQKPTVPEAIEAAEGEELVLIARASGFQIYVCRPDAEGKPAWILKAPEAQLFDQQGNAIGSHFGGPTWRHKDGSEITGRLAAKVDAPEATAIPWLLIAVTGNSGNGVLSGVTTIQRINTIGGLAPAASECMQGGEVEFRSSYSADYYFYARR
ncbi:MAG TPA: DUF3455 domain-containing protein [Candidatus Angelobacter sp.]